MGAGSTNVSSTTDRGAGIGAGTSVGSGGSSVETCPWQACPWQACPWQGEGLATAHFRVNSLSNQQQTCDIRQAGVAERATCP
jgi:hypothetical protein